MPYSNLVNEVKFSLLVISDNYDETNDLTGKNLIENIAKSDNIIISYQYIKNDESCILKAIDNILSYRDVDAVICTGGTGLSKRDRTIEIISKLFDKTIEGFGEIYRKILYKEYGEEALLTRSCAGVINDKIIFCLPGATHQSKLAIEKLILPSIQQMVEEVKYME